jgi:tetraacyldisaccharide 4'-kinase
MSTSRPSDPATAVAATSSSSGSPLEALLTRAWMRRGPLACALWPLSLVFRALSCLRRLLYRVGALHATRLNVPVIVVGNIFIGGTGKTPLTIWLVETLVAAGFHPGVISRGHGSAGNKNHLPRLVTPESTPQQVGDEPLLIAQRSRCPVMVGADRAATGLALLQAHPELDVLVSDDGLQHYALWRDIEIVLFDARATGNGWLLPAGPLREGPRRRRDFTVINAPQLSPALLATVAPRGEAATQMQLVGEFAERLSNRGQRMALAVLAASNLRIVAAAGIGNPGRFFAMLKLHGVRCAELALPDHHGFLDRPFATIEADIILITEKDAVKCAQIEDLKDDPRLWVVPVSARIDAALAQQIVEKCRGCSLA